MSSYLTNFVKILEHPAGSLISIKGKVTYIGEVKKICRKNSADVRPLRKRDISVSDSAGMCIWISLWNNIAETFGPQLDELVAFTNFKIELYQSRTSLSSLPFSKICQLPLDDSLRVAFSGTARCASMPLDGFTSLGELNNRATGTKQYAWIRCKPLSFVDSPFYSGCSECRKAKHSDFCDKCNKETETTTEIALRIYVEDDVCLPITAFRQCVELWFGKTVEQLKDDINYYEKKIAEFTGAQICVRVGYYTEVFHERSYLKLSAYSIQSIV